MGQKVNPVGMRIGINKDWTSKWYAGNKDFAKYLKVDNEIRNFLNKSYLYTFSTNVIHSFCIESG